MPPGVAVGNALRRSGSARIGRKMRPKRPEPSRANTDRPAFFGQAGTLCAGHQEAVLCAQRVAFVVVAASEVATARVQKAAVKLGKSLTAVSDGEERTCSSDGRAIANHAP